MQNKKLDKRKKKMSDPEGYYPLLEAEVIKAIVTERVKGSAIDLTWVQKKAKELNNLKRFGYECNFSLHWVKNVLERHGMGLHAPQNTKKESAASAIPKVFKFHIGIHALLNTCCNDVISLHIFIVVVVVMYWFFFHYIYIYKEDTLFLIVGIWMKCLCHLLLKQKK